MSASQVFCSIALVLYNALQQWLPNVFANPMGVHGKMSVMACICAIRLHHKAISHLVCFPTAHVSEKNALVPCSLSLKTTVLCLIFHTRIFKKTMERRATGEYLGRVVTQIVGYKGFLWPSTPSLAEYRYRVDYGLFRPGSLLRSLHVLLCTSVKQLFIEWLLTFHSV
jgi:hypothetical protein